MYMYICDNELNQTKPNQTNGLSSNLAVEFYETGIYSPVAAYLKYG